MTTRLAIPLLPFALAGAACGGGGGEPPPVVLDEPTIVVITNPAVNDGNEAPVPAPGVEQDAITIADDTSLSAVTNAEGIAVLAPVEPGARTLDFSGLGVDGQVGVTLGDGELREVAVAVDDTGAEIMAEVFYDFDGQIVEVHPDAAPADVNAALTMSDTIVFFHGGVYVGDVEFAGSNVTLFGEGPEGGQVTIEGNVMVSGSGNRIRGAVITGSLTVDGSNAGVTFTTVLGPVDVSGSGAKLIHNVFCDQVTVSASGLTLLGNAGILPVSALCP